MDVSLQTIALWVLPVVFAITLHEAAHGYVAKMFGDRTAEMQGRITLNPLKHIDPVGTILVPGVLILAAKLGGPQFVFGWAKPVPVNFGNLRDPKRDMLWVAAAGPGANFVMAALWALVVQGSRARRGFRERAPVADGEDRNFGQPDIDGAQPVAHTAARRRPHCRKPAARARGARVRAPRAFRACSSSSDCWRSALLDNVMGPLLRSRRVVAAGVARVSSRPSQIPPSLPCSPIGCCRACGPPGACISAIYHGALKNWIRLQEEYECLFFAADWHALTTHYDEPETIADSVWEMFVDWLAAGIDPDARDAVHPVARARARRAHAAARHDHAGRLARARADVQGPAAEARRPRPVELTASSAIR